MNKLFLIVLTVFFFITSFLPLYAQTQSVQIVKKTEKIEYDDDKTANNKEYFGWAKIGSATSAAVWKIMRITYTGNDFVLDWADGNMLYDNSWDNRSSLTYK